MEVHYARLNSREKKIVDSWLNQRQLSRYEKLLGFRLAKGEDFETIRDQLSSWILFSGALSRFDV